ncbi:MAG TPA: hypothetical protein VGX03_22685 [Candidatus Binatia bacterium]|jgi:hypothetical protein|nr:hypothetical protein [Candidatus Binatia bacterium]
MAKLPYDPAQEKDRLSAATSAVHQHWGTAEMAYAYEDLLQAVAHAEQARAVLDPLQDTRGHAFKVHMLGLGGMILYAREELARVERFALPLRKRATVLPPPSELSSPVFLPPGWQRVRQEPLPAHYSQPVLL